MMGCPLTDQVLRQFTRSPRRTLAELNDRGKLSRLEADALLATAITVWSDVAARIDQRAPVSTIHEDEHDHSHEVM
jgi:hypothetical protein